MYTFRIISLLILPLLAFGFVNSEKCKDDRGFDITSCSRCLWETDCYWCADEGDFSFQFSKRFCYNVINLRNSYFILNHYRF